MKFRSQFREGCTECYLHCCGVRSDVTMDQKAPMIMVGGGGFFLACKDFGRMFDNSFPACAFFFFFKVEISSRELIPLFRPGLVHSG